MKYEKPFLLYEEQAELLLSRGLIADKDMLINRLVTVNYYRLSGYLYNFRNIDDTFKPGTTLDAVWRQYTFDRRFRLAVIDAIERVEIALRSRLAYAHAREHGAFGYLDPRTLPMLKDSDYRQWSEELFKEFNKSSERFVRHFSMKYGKSHSLPPIWIAVELMTFGKAVTFFRGCDSVIKKEISAWFSIPDQVLFSWLRSLNEVRNVCAHHGRLWNRELGNNFLLPSERKFPDWHTPYKVGQNKMFGILTCLRYLLRAAAPTSGWQDRLRALFEEYPDILLEWIGFPPDWERSPLWSE